MIRKSGNRFSEKDHAQTRTLERNHDSTSGDFALVGRRSRYASPFGASVSVALAEARMTQTELAAKTGRSTAYVNQLITGHKKPSPEWVDLIADTLHALAERTPGAACRRRQAARLQARPDQEIAAQASGAACRDAITRPDCRSQRGMARRKTQYGSSRLLLRDRGGAFRRATCAQAGRSGSACYLRRLFGGGPRFIPGQVRVLPAAKPGSANTQVVSQLLAGPRSGPGRSPGAARVLKLRA